MKLPTYWRVWYRADDGIWRQMTFELGNLDSLYFRSLADAETAARRLTERADVLDVEVREERSVLALPGAGSEGAKK